MDVEGRHDRRTPRPRRDMHPGLNFFYQQRKYFMLKVYILAMTFICLTCLQWLIIITNKHFLEFFRARYYIPLLAALCSLMILTIFALFEGVRFSQPYNWIVAFLITELSMLGLMLPVLDSSLDHWLICFISIGTVVLVFSYIGHKLPRDVTPDIVILTGISLMFYLVTSFSLIFVIVTNMYFPSLLILGPMLVLQLMYIMLDAQLIAGNRSDMIRWNDYIMAALLVYFNFIVMFTLSLFVASILTNKDLDDRII